MTLLYDGSFEGFLTLVYDVYYKKLEVEKIVKEVPNTLLLEEIYSIQTDDSKANKVLNAIQTKFKKNYFEDILVVFMCDTKPFELDLLGFIILGFKDQKNLENINYEVVFSIKNYLKEYFRFHHKMTGFVRFCELEDGTLYAKIDVKFNIVYHLGRHFLKRLNNQNYIIHDVVRKVAFIKNENFVGVQEVAHVDIPKFSQNEEKFSKLWREFFKSVSIKERENPKLQKQWIPLIYRTYMTEFI